MKLFVIFLVCCSLLQICSESIFAAQEIPMLESISFAPGEGETEIITFKLKGADLPKIFIIKGDNPRLVFDFHNASYNGKSKISVEGSELVKKIRSAVHREPKLKTRVVVDLTTERDISYQEDFQVHSSTLKIKISPAAKALAKEKSESLINTSADTEQKLVTSVASSTKETPKTAESAPATEKKAPTNAPDEKPSPEVSEIAAAESQAEATQVHILEPQKPEAKAVNAVETTTPADLLKATSAAVAPVLLDVSFDGTSDKGELVQFKLNDFFAPTVSAIEEGTPRVICDFAGMRMDSNVRTLIPAGGKYVNTIRVVQHQEPEKIRIVLDLQPNHSYDLQQVFFKEEKIFVLIINVLDQEQQSDGK